MSTEKRPTLRPFFKALRDQGFLKAYDSHAGGIRTVSFQHLIGERHVDVQFWGDGRHRISHFLKGRMSTHPTPFQTVPEMEAALKHELTRTDHPPRK